jgi:DNA repair protein RadA/Sms
VAAAVASSWTDRAIDPKTVIFGEIGLAGEIRAVPQADIRLREAVALGFARCVMPARNAERAEACGVGIVGVEDIHHALEALGIR